MGGSERVKSRADNSDINISRLLETVLEETSQDNIQQDLTANINNEERCQKPREGTVLADSTNFQNNSPIINSPNFNASENRSPNLSTIEYGSFHCAKFRDGKRCDTCKHMVEKSYVVSHFYNQTFRIHGHLAHDIGVPNKR